jgi:IMP dehydrogenase
MVRKSLTYDDILLVPRYSEITSREMVKLKTRVSKRYGILIPYVASCMDTVCDKEMAKSLMSLGGVGCIHRFMSIEEQCKQIAEVSEHKKECVEEWGIMFDDWHTEIADIPVMAAIGVMPEDVERAKELVKSGANVILIDVAHGHHLNVKNMVEKLKSELPNHVDIIGGNIATTKAAIDLCDWGVDGLRVGIGGGSACDTRIKTGHGIPNITSIMDCSNVSDVPVMADGGIRTSGDIAKALAMGAESVMLGSLLAGTTESPGEIITNGNGEQLKKYRGSASLETKQTHNQQLKNVEGVSTMIKYKGDVKTIINDLNDGVKSALSYSGCKTINEFNINANYTEITTAGMVESKPHIL